MKRTLRGWLAGTAALAPGIAVAAAVPPLVATAATDSAAEQLDSDAQELAAAEQTSMSESAFRYLALPSRTPFVPALLGVTGLQLSGTNVITVQKERGSAAVTYRLRNGDAVRSFRKTFTVFALHGAVDPAAVLADASAKLRSATNTSLTMAAFNRLPDVADQSPRLLGRALGLGELLISEAARISFTRPYDGTARYTVKVRGLTTTVQVAISSLIGAQGVAGASDALANVTASSLVASEFADRIIPAGTPLTEANLGLLTPEFPAGMEITVAKEQQGASVTYTIRYDGSEGTRAVTLRPTGQPSSDQTYQRAKAALNLMNASTLTERAFVNLVLYADQPFNETLLGIRRPPSFEGFNVTVSKPRFMDSGQWAEPTGMTVTLTYEGRSENTFVIIRRFAPAPLDDRIALAKAALRRPLLTALTGTAFRDTAVSSGTLLDSNTSLGIAWPEETKGLGIRLEKRGGDFFFNVLFYGYGVLFDVLQVRRTGSAAVPAPVAP